MLPVLQFQAIHAIPGGMIPIPIDSEVKKGRHKSLGFPVIDVELGTSQIHISVSKRHLMILGYIMIYH